MNVCIYRVRHLTFFQLVLILWMVTLTSYLIWQIISFILPPNEYGCVYAWPSGPAIDLRNMPILTKKNHLFRWSSFRSWRVCKQAKLSHLRHRKPVRIDWKPLHPKQVIVWCGFWSRGINGPFFFENEQGEAVTVNGDRYRALLNELLFTKIEEEDIGNIWFQQDGATGLTAETTLDVLSPVFEDRIIGRRADGVWPFRSCNLTPLDNYLWGAVKDKGYAENPETIDALKDNIREAFGKIQLHTIDNVLKNCRSCRLLHGQPKQPFVWNIFHY